jgi:hypothetical protein
MNHPTRSPRAWILALAVLVAVLGLLILQTPARLQASTSLKLQPPGLPQRAGAAQEAAAVSTISDEAGIAAYFNAGAPINLDSVADQYATIEARTDSYIIGSVAVPQYNERHQVHVYVHKDGWIMAYYLKTDPVAKMVDIKAYGGASISTKFDTILSLFASEAGVTFVPPTFWDFQAPNANHMMIVAENYTGGDTFTVKLPGTYIFYDQSWASGGTTPGVLLDGTNVTNAFWSDDGVAEGAISAESLSLDVVHTFKVNASGKAAVVFIYRVP